MDRERLRLKKEQFIRDMRRVSEEKSQQLFEKPEDREAWVDVIRKSVEKEIETRVREALGTPPKERQRKRMEELTAKRFAKIEEEKKAIANNRKKQAFLENGSAIYDDLLWLRRQKYLEKFKKRRTMREIPSPVLRSISLKRIARDEQENHQSTPIVWECSGALADEMPTSFKQFKRAVHANNLFESTKETVNRNGPYFPSGRLPCIQPPQHLHFVPNYVEELNLTETNDTRQKQVINVEYPKCWKGAVVVFDTERRNILDSEAVPPGCPPHLQFESRFESGNLRQAKRVGNYAYELILNTDLYTKRHTQWYYFQVRKTIPHVTYTFTIINFLKKDSLYNHGMKVLFYSEKTAQRQNIGWTRRGHHIKYFQNYIKGHPLLSWGKVYYSLTFQLEFPHVNDVCYLAHCYPYSYTDLENYLDIISKDEIKQNHCSQQVLCKTVAGNNCYLLTITSQEPNDGKLGVVVTARVHPGETNASWMMKGLVDFLISDDSVAQQLRRKHIFKIIPMLNPDGVIVGNYRTNLAAKDLNRTYMNPSKDSSPTIFYTKKLVETFSTEQEIVVYCDLHGHSRKPNVFMYGCTPEKRSTSVKDFVQERLFPWLMSKKAPDLFSFRECKFKVRKSKEGTARVVMWRQMGVANSFTMEATFCGANFGDIEKGRHFHNGDFEAMGRHFCEVLLDYTTARPNGSRSEITEEFLQMASLMTQDIMRHARMLQTGENEDRWSTKNDVIDKQHSPKNHVNVFDVHVDDVISHAESGEEVEVSVRKSEGSSLEECLKQLENIDLDELNEESDSSDSDSQSEEEDVKKSMIKNEDRTKKKKKKKKEAKRWEVLAALKPKSELQTERTNQGMTNTKKYQEKNVLSFSQRKVKLKESAFLNPYASRFNNGIPMYSQERIEQRIMKKNEDVKGHEIQSHITENDLLPFLHNDDRLTSNSFPQHNLACYVMSRRPGTGSRAEVIAVDNFKFESLNHSASKGFTLRIPGRELSARSSSDHYRLEVEKEYELEDKFCNGELLVPMRSNVTLNPLNISKGTAYAYDLKDFSERREQLSEDWGEDCQTKVVRVTCNTALQQSQSKIKNKIHSIKKLQELSLRDGTHRDQMFKER